MQSRPLKLFAYCVALALAATLIFIFRHAIVTVIAGNPLAVIAAYVLSVAQILLQARNYSALLPPDATRLGLLPTARIWAIGGLANYVAPFQAGIGVRMAMFMRNGISVSESIQAIGQQAHLTAWVATGMAGVAAVLANRDLLVPGIACMAVFALWPLMHRFMRRLVKRLEIPEGRPVLTRLGAVLSLPPVRYSINPAVQLLVVACSIGIVYGTLGASLTAPEAALLGSVTTLSGIVAITPNNLGVLDAILAFAATSKGLDAGSAVALAVIYRIAHIGANVSLLLLPGRGPGRQ